MSIVAIAVLVAASNVCVLTAMGAGRALTGWNRARWLIAEFVMYGVVFWASAHVSAAPSGIFVILALVGGFAIGVLIAFAEYSLIGLRSRFGVDLSRSLWLGRFADPFCATAPYPDRTSA